MPSRLSELIVPTGVVFVAAFLGTTGMRRLARRRGWMALPRPDRWHKEPTALHGGVGFYPAFCIGGIWILGRAFGGQSLEWDHTPAGGGPFLAGALLMGSLLMFLFGLWDDVRRFRPATKFLCELAAASIFLFAGGVIPLSGIPILDVLATYFWFVGITNAVNMLDNMDGLSSGIVIIAAATLVLLAGNASVQGGDWPLAVSLGLMLVASLAGFWIYNKPPASIFMGDSGSLSIGYALAALSVPSPLNGYLGIRSLESVLGAVMALLIPATVLAVPIFDTTFVTLTRKWRSAKATQGGRDHSSHRLVGLGLSERTTIAILYALSAFGGLVAVLMQRFPGQSFPLLVLFAIILALIGVYLGHIKVQTADPERIPPAWTPLVSEILYKRRAAEVLFDTVLIVFCFYCAYLFRYGGAIPSSIVSVATKSLPLVVASCLFAFFLAGIYRGQWRLIALSDMVRYLRGTFGGALLGFLVGLIADRQPAVDSWSVYANFFLLLFLALTGSRLSLLLMESLFRRLRKDSTPGPASRQPVLIYGAGKAGKILHDEILSSEEMKSFICIGFIDDDATLAGRELGGKPIRGREEWRQSGWDRPPEIWISSRSIPGGVATQLSKEWNGSAVIRRLRLEMESISNTRKRPGDGEPRRASIRVRRATLEAAADEGFPENRAKARRNGSALPLTSGCEGMGPSIATRTVPGEPTPPLDLESR